MAVGQGIPLRARRYWALPAEPLTGRQGYPSRDAIRRKERDTSSVPRQSAGRTEKRSLSSEEGNLHRKGRLIRQKSAEGIVGGLGPAEGRT